MSSTEEINQAEIGRILNNWRALLDAMPEMVLLIRDDFVIQYLNPSATKVFGKVTGQFCHQAIGQSDKPCMRDCAVVNVRNKQAFKGLIEKQVGNMHVEYSFVPFQGYKGDCLVMVIMRDITARKQSELELKQINKNIEEVLTKKIVSLKESERIRSLLAQEVNVLKQQMERHSTTDEMVGNSRRMREMREMIYQVADSDATILITGESGTGKELAANLIRNCSHRKDKPFLKVNCSAINDSLLESDLFGYEKGAFTGANAKKIGKFEVVDGGTILLDEIGGISARMQAALLRILQNGEIIRVGGTKEVKVNVRILAATNIDLAAAVQAGDFRLDLFYRLNIINIHMPALRERKEDIVELAAHFVRHYRTAFRKEIDFLPASVIDRLLQHDWPGNVRELENVIQRAVLMAKGNMIVEQDTCFERPTASALQEFANLKQIAGSFYGQPLKEARNEFERLLIEDCLQRHDGKILDAAQTLGVGKTVLYEKIKRYNVTV
ncbi:MAG: hypothetical protein A2521_01125 [Deltaproteobacteria bacterium RIFOXYD12_FULL_57_12]|nr:MAG: hypothetical protein A2521_01125 [Deltaproteobacteria bacterium RIFOXYD12_FULL_57_12]